MRCVSVLPEYRDQSVSASFFLYCALNRFLSLKWKWKARTETGFGSYQSYLTSKHQRAKKYAFQFTQGLFTPSESEHVEIWVQIWIKWRLESWLATKQALILFHSAWVHYLLSYIWFSFLTFKMISASIDTFHPNYILLVLILNSKYAQPYHPMVPSSLRCVHNNFITLMQRFNDLCTIGLIFVWKIFIEPRFDWFYIYVFHFIINVSGVLLA